MNILVTGGAGYIGAITSNLLKQNGHQITILDSLEYHSQDKIRNFDVIKGHTYDYELVFNTLKKHNIDAVIHFAAFIEAGESMQNPGKYFYNNYVGSLKLLDAMVEAGVDKLVFSSTAAVYGIPRETPIRETAPKQPINPYGESKRMVEKTLNWYSQIHNLKSISLRYFNASGAALDGSLGEDHMPETHLIPNIINTHKQGKPFTLFGEDYNTQDGTCIRDYIHIQDLASAHIVALDALQKGHQTDVFNVGTGTGYSIKQIIQMVEKISGEKIDVTIGPRRPGDPDELIADSTKIQTQLGWKPRHSDLKTIIQTAWDWHTINSSK